MQYRVNNRINLARFKIMQPQQQIISQFQEAEGFVSANIPADSGSKLSVVTLQMRLSLEAAPMTEIDTG